MTFSCSFAALKNCPNQQKIYHQRGVFGPPCCSSTAFLNDSMTGDVTQQGADKAAALEYVADPRLLSFNPVTAINLMPPSLKIRPPQLAPSMCVILDSPLVFGLALTTPATFID